MAFLFGDRVLTPIGGCLLGILRQPSPVQNMDMALHTFYGKPLTRLVYIKQLEHHFLYKIKNNWGILTEPSEGGTSFAEIGNDLIINTNTVKL